MPRRGKKRLLDGSAVELLDDDCPDEDHAFFPDAIPAGGQVELVPYGKWTTDLAHHDRDTPSIR